MNKKLLHLPTTLSILNLISLGPITNAGICEQLGLYKQQTNYHIQKLLKLDYIEKIVGRTYTINKNGKKTLGGCSLLSLKQLPRLENMRYKFPILSGIKTIRNYYTSDSQGKLNNSTVDNIKFGGNTIRIIHCTSPSIEICCSHQYGWDPHELQEKALEEAKIIAQTITKQWNLVLGEPQSAMGPEWANPTPLAEAVLDASGSSQIRCVDGVFNRSKGRDADMEVYDPQYAQKILDIPKTLSRIEKSLATCTGIQSNLFL